jgi:hypothetical protein
MTHGPRIRFLSMFHDDDDGWCQPRGRAVPAPLSPHVLPFALRPCFPGRKVALLWGSASQDAC